MCVYVCVCEKYTYKNKTPPREKYADVACGELKNTVPRMIAWNIKELTQQNSVKEKADS